MRARSFVISVLFVVFASVRARADEGGVPFWLSGQYASLAAVPSTPGLYLPVLGYFFYGTAGADKQFTRGEAVAAGLKSRLPLIMIEPTYAPRPKIFGGQLSFGLGWGVGYNRTQADLSISPSRGMELGRVDEIWGITDLYPIISLAWASGDANGMVYVTGDGPIGSYDSKRLSNIGIGHGAIDAGGGFTYLNQKNGHEASAVVGFTYNFENTSTNYQNGVDSHLDWALSQFLSNNFDVGLVGYVYYQLTADSGSGAKLGSFESGVASVGAQFLSVFKLFGLPAELNLRGYWEFWSQNRLEGATGFATLVFPIVGQGPAAGSQ